VHSSHIYIPATTLDNVQRNEIVAEVDTINEEQQTKI
jgi:hypothetical protein